MGYEIEVIVVTIHKDFYTKHAVIQDFYLSYNWSDINKEYKWSVVDDVDGLTLSETVKRLSELLKRLEADGVKEVKPDDKNRNWWWGTNDDGKLLAQHERKAIFKHVIGIIYSGMKKILEETKYDVNRIFCVTDIGKYEMVCPTSGKRLCSDPFEKVEHLPCKFEYQKQRYEVDPVSNTIKWLESVDEFYDTAN